MTKTLSSTYASLYTLSGAADNPATITATGLLEAGLNGASLGSAWTITNSGSVLGAGVTLASVGTVANAGSIAGTGTNARGVELQAGGSVTNATAAAITGGYDGISVVGGAGTVFNYGSVAGITGNGVYLNTGGSATNETSGTITGGVSRSGVGIGGFAGTVVNYGSIANTNAGGIGVDLAVGGSATNAPSASIMAVGFGIIAHGGGGTVVNDGNIVGTGTNGFGVSLGSGGTVLNDGSITATGTRGIGVDLAVGGSVTNSASASITGGSYGVLVHGASTVVNYGSIAGTINSTGTSGRGVQLDSGGAITNGVSALITGLFRGAEISGDAGVVVNRGSITSTSTSGNGVQIGLGGGVGTVVNFGSIASAGSSGFGVILESGGSVANYGSITSTGADGDGVDLSSGGSVTNAASASITGSSYGVLIHTGAGTVVNYGSIAGTINSTGTSGRGVQLDLGGSITNGVSASLTGVYRGAEISGGAGVVVNKGSIASTGTSGNGVEIGYGGGVGTVVNSGSIASTFDAAIKLESGGSTTNAASASITGGLRGVRIYGDAGTVVNFGSIVGTIAGAGTIGFGVELESGGNVTNAESGSITGSTLGVYLSAGGTLTNAGTIVGNSGTAVVLGGTGSNLLTLDPGFGFSGLVTGSSSASNTLELASGASGGTLTGLGASYVGFGQITVGAFASWMLDGANTISSGQTLTELNGASLIDAGTLENNGVIVLDPSTLTGAGLTGTGSVTIDAGSTLDLQGKIASGETLTFGGNGAYLHLGTPGSASGSVTNFDFGETIDLKGIDPASVSYAGGTLNFSGGSFALSLASAGTVTASASSDGADVTLLCFCANTLILTPSGERPVQELAVGNMVTPHRGKERRIVWIGSGKVLATRGRRSPATPVIVRKGALGDGVPNCDLRLTKGHALYLDGALIPVEYLINHRTIEWDDWAQEVELYHIELESHDVVIANGAPAESYRDDGNRWLFRNANSGWHLPPQEPCAQVLTGGAIVDTVWRRLLERAGPRPGLPLTDDPDLHLLVDGKRIDPIDIRDAMYAFRLGTRPRSVRIRSRSAVPLELGIARDPRPLGVAIRRIVLAQARRQRVIEANAASLSEGYHTFETEHGVRWTMGDAEVPAELFAGMTGTSMLILNLAFRTSYVADSSKYAAA